MQLAAELEAVELGVLGVGQRDGRRRARRARPPARRSARGARLVDLRPRGCVVDEAGEVLGQRRVGGHRDGRGGLAVEEAARRARTRCASGSRLKSRAGRGVPAREERELGLAVLADLEGQLGRRGRAARADRSRTRARGRRAATPSSSASSSALSAVNGRSSRLLADHGAPSSSSGGSPESVRRRKAPPRSSVGGDHAPRQRSESLSQCEHLVARHRARESGRARPRPAWRCAGRRARASACAASRTSAPAARLTASFSSSSNGKAKTSSGSRGLSARSQTRPQPHLAGRLPGSLSLCEQPSRRA